MLLSGRSCSTSWYDTYQGVVVLVRVVDGAVRPGQKIKLWSTGAVYEVQSVGVFTPKMAQTSELSPGDVGYIIAGIKRVADAKIGDTIMDAERSAAQPLPGYKEVKPMVFAGLYPMNSDDYADLKGALEKLRLNDSSFTYEPETSSLSASGSAAVSWGCFIWTSSKSGSSGNSSSPSYPRRPP